MKAIILEFQSAFDIFRLSDDHLPHELIEGVDDKDIEQIQTTVSDGHDLVEGVFTVVSRPEAPSIRIAETKAVGTCRKSTRRKMASSLILWWFY